MANTTKVSEVSICNQALSWLGQPAITSLDQKSTAAELCKLNYPHLRDALTEARMWTFATVREESSSKIQSGQQGFFEHNIPEAWLAVYRVYRSTISNRQVQANWIREGTKVLVDETDVELWGLLRIEDPARFSLLFVQALAARIAADLCNALTQNRQLQIDLWGIYEAKLSEAAVRDGQQGRAEEVGSSRLLEARGGFSGGLIGVEGIGG